MNKAFFLDRDGVLNIFDKIPPNKPEELQLFPGAAKAVAMLKQAGYHVFVVTNQGGVGLGYLSEANLEAVHQKLRDEIEDQGGYFDEIRACTHKPRAGCACRKPKPGMILDLASKFKIDLPNSYMVGDRDMDIQAGIAAGTRTVFIGSSSDAPAGVDLVSPSLVSAVDNILGGL